MAVASAAAVAVAVVCRGRNRGRGCGSVSLRPQAVAVVADVAVVGAAAVVLWMGVAGEVGSGAMALDREVAAALDMGRSTHADRKGSRCSGETVSAAVEA